MLDIKEKAGYSLSRIEEFKNELFNSNELKQQAAFCIYTTGSYGRLEACEYSDIDLFFLFDSEKSKFSRISQTLISADVILTSRKMKFPEFSGDGEYLEAHDIKIIHKELGSRNDDHYNYFTARMLLLLESKCIHNLEFYDQILETTVDKYYKDFHEHEKNFQPIFLVNDVIRFWRTMCLNYEHNRSRKFSEPDMSESDILKKKNKAHIKNLKLKFSRKLTCYSFLLSVLYSKGTLDQQSILEIIKKTPLDRIKELSEFPSAKEGIHGLIKLYSWFLEMIQKDESTLLSWISEKSNRVFAFEKSRQFSIGLFNLMNASENKENLMYFLV